MIKLPPFHFLLVAFFLFTACDKIELEPGEESGSGGFPGLNPATPCEVTGNGIAYNVGPGMTYEKIIDVPFEDLKPGDAVFIHAKSTPYHERILLTRSGTAEYPICVCGVPDEQGNLPTLDGANARIRPPADDVNSFLRDELINYAMIVVAFNYGDYPAHLKIQNLRITGANAHNESNPNQYYVHGTDNLVTYSPGTSGIWMRGTDIEISNCIIEENGEGIFGAYNGPEQPLADIKLYNNIIRNNGEVGSFLRHNIYLEADNLTVVGNQIGPTYPGSLGGNLKSRGAGDVIMYNKLVGPALRHFDLVEAQNSYEWLAQKESFRNTYVVGNLVVGAEYGAGNILHYGGDGDNTTPSDDLRQGTVYAYNNTFILKGFYEGGNPNAEYRKSFMDLNTCNEKLYAFNNIFAYEYTGKGDQATNTLIHIFRLRGDVSEFSNNLVSEDTVSWYNDNTNGDPCNLNLDYGIIQASMASVASMGFFDFSNGDYHLKSGSAAIGKGMEVPANLPAVEYQFTMPNGIEKRTDGGLDIGAFEFK